MAARRFAAAAAVAWCAACQLGLAGTGPMDLDGGLITHDELHDGSGRGAGDDAPQGNGGIVPDDGPAAPTGTQDGAPTGTAGPPSGGCDLNGTWASHITIDVSWVPQGATGVILAPGTGRIVQWLKATRVQNGTSTTDVAVVCGIQLPDFSGTQLAGAETYGVRFPDALFDDDLLPSFVIVGGLSDTVAGATYTTKPVAALLGLSLANPTTAPWPSTVTSSIDQDNDGKPGITLAMAHGGRYSDAPVDFSKSPRADRLYVVIRQVTAISAKVDDCDHVSGTVSIPQIASGSGGKYAIDSHVVGCRLDDGSGDCDATQASFVDATQPVFSPSGGSTFTSARVSSDTTCAAVRAMFP